MADNTKFLATGDLKADPSDSKVGPRHFCPHFTGRLHLCGTGTTPLPHGGQACDVLCVHASGLRPPKESSSFFSSPSCILHHVWMTRCRTLGFFRYRFVSFLMDLIHSVKSLGFWMGSFTIRFFADLCNALLILNDAA